MITRSAWGRMIRFMVQFGLRPSAKDASDWPLDTAWMPARTFSAMKAPV